MIRADFYKSREQKLLGFQINGHAGLAEQGYDVACAAVSSAVMMACNTITEVYKINAAVESYENDILLKLREDRNGDGDKSLLGLMMLLDMISHEYPNSIKISVYER